MTSPKGTIGAESIRAAECTIFHSPMSKHKAVKPAKKDLPMPEGLQLEAGRSDRVEVGVSTSESHRMSGTWMWMIPEPFWFPTLQFPIGKLYRTI